MAALFLREAACGLAITFAERDVGKFREVGRHPLWLVELAAECKRLLERTPRLCEIASRLRSLTESAKHVRATLAHRE